MFASRSFAVGLTLYSVVTSYYLVLSVSLQDGLGLSALGAGLVHAPPACAFLAASLLAGRLIPRHGRRMLEVGAVVPTAGYVTTIAVLLGAPGSLPGLLIPSLVLQSFGGGLVLTPSLNVVLTRIRPADVGMASGALSFAQQRPAR